MSRGCLRLHDHLDHTDDLSITFLCVYKCQFANQVEWWQFFHNQSTLTTFGSLMLLPLSLPECLDTAVAIIKTRASPLTKPKGKFCTPPYPERQVLPLSNGSSSSPRYHSCSRLHSHKRHFEPSHVVILFELYGLCHPRPRYSPWLCYGLEEFVCNVANLQCGKRQAP